MDGTGRNTLRSVAEDAGARCFFIFSVKKPSGPSAKKEEKGKWVRWEGEKRFVTATVRAALENHLNGRIGD